MRRPNIVIGCPIRDRAWILPEYLKAISNIEYQNKSFLFFENDSSDETKNILIDFTKENVNALLYSTITKLVGYNRDMPYENKYSHMASIRNLFIGLFLETNADYLFSVDSDVIVSKNVLDKLIVFANDRTIVSVGICNVPGKRLDGITSGNFMVEENNKIVHPNKYPLSGLMNVCVTGAVYLIPRRALAYDGIRYTAHSQGEDVGFCLSAKEKGYEIKTCFDIACDHRMIK
jgi:hypothetical protein